MPDSPIDPNWVVDLTRRAGEIALSFFGKTTGKLKSDHSWVTEADLTVEEFLRTAIAETRSQDAIIGEEGDKKIDYPGKVISLGSAAAHLCYVARGSAVGAMDKAGIWDYAAGAAILRSLGITCRYVSGNEGDFVTLFDGNAVKEPTLIAPDSCFECLREAAVIPN